MSEYKSNHTRRGFCKTLMCGAAALPLTGQAYAGLLSGLFDNFPERKVMPRGAPRQLWEWSREARHYTILGNKVICTLCPNRCEMEPEARSRCLVRVNKNGQLYSLVYGNPSAINVDPIEKKPLYHFHPATSAFSLGFAGCNLQCLNCQNWELSQNKPEKLTRHSLYPPQAVKAAVAKNCLSMAYTYNEPSVVFEYMIDTARLAREAGLKNVWITNGYINPDPLGEYCQYLDAANVDLKSFSNDTYKKLNYGKLEPVLKTLLLLKKRDVWFEITTLIVPTYTDDMAMIRKMCKWIKSELGADNPLHFSRFHPQFKLDHLPPTPPSKLIEARDIAIEEGLHHVYIGNYRAPDGAGANTICHNCKKAVIERIGFMITDMNIKSGKCTYCDTAIAGRWA